MDREKARAGDLDEDPALISVNYSRSGLNDYVRFLFYCFLLIVPVYAVIVSALRGNWLMMIIDLMLMPVGFVHGVLLLTGLVD